MTETGMIFYKSERCERCGELGAVVIDKIKREELEHDDCLCLCPSCITEAQEAVEATKNNRTA